MAKRRRQLISRAARVAIDDATIDELPAPWRRIGTVPRRFWIAHRPGIQDPPCPYIFIERQAFSKGSRGQCWPCPTPLSQPIIVRSLSLALVIIRVTSHVFPPLYLIRQNFPEISLDKRRTSLFPLLLFFLPRLSYKLLFIPRVGRSASRG